MLAPTPYFTSSHPSSFLPGKSGSKSVVPSGGPPGSVPGSSKKRRKPKSTEMTCNVCGDKAPDHIHYGGIACFSCRAFFRRSVPKQSSYFCSSEQACAITVSTRKNCQFCRYKKCLDSGMKPSWVLSEEEKSTRRFSSNSGSSSRKSPSPPLLLPPTSNVDGHLAATTSLAVDSTPTPLATANNEYIQSSSSSFTAEESRRLENLLFAQDSTRHCIPMPDGVMREILDLTRCPGLHMSPRGVTEIYRVVYSRVAKFATYVEPFESLPPGDKKLLLSKNMDSMAILRALATFSSDGKGDLRAQLRATGSPLYGPPGPHYISVDQVFRSPWAKSEEHAGAFKNTFSSLASLCLGERAGLLLQLVTLFSVLELPVSQRAVIEAAQERLGSMLLRYLKSTQMRPGNVLRVFLALAELRYLSNLLTEPSATTSPNTMFPSS